MALFKQIIDFLYQHFQECSNIINIIFIVIPGIILIVALVKLLLNRQEYKKTNQPPVTKNKYYLNQSYLICIIVLCIYTELHILASFYYQTKLEKINREENQELKLREKLWDVEKQTLELEIKKLQEQMKKQQLQEKIGDQTQS